MKYLGLSKVVFFLSLFSKDYFMHSSKYYLWLYFIIINNIFLLVSGGGGGGGDYYSYNYYRNQNIENKSGEKNNSMATLSDKVKTLIHEMTWIWLQRGNLEKLNLFQ